MTIGARSAAIFAAAFFVTLAFAVFQGHTGPAYPVKGSVLLNSSVVKYKLPRSGTSGKDSVIRISAVDKNIQGTVIYRRFPTKDQFSSVKMTRDGQSISASLPAQPPAGKLEYQIRLDNGDSKVYMPAKPTVIRFKGSVPPYVLAPHVILIFLGLLFTVMAAMEPFFKIDPLKDSKIAFVLLLSGGMVLGPIVQKFAFGAFWTGWPCGGDWTDNKMAFAILAWIIALLLMSRNERHKRWAPLFACGAVLIIFGIPHSFRGSELDWSKIPAAP